MNQNYSNHMTNMAIQGSLYFYFTSFSKIRFTILILFSLLVSVKNLSSFPYTFIQVQVIRKMIVFIFFFIFSPLGTSQTSFSEIQMLMHTRSDSLLA